MSSAAIVKACSHTEEWITQEEQLKRLALPQAQAYLSGKLKKQPDLVIKKATDYAVQFILRHLDDNKDQKRVPSLQELAVERLIDPKPLHPTLTNWYTALQYLGYNEQVPALPHHMPMILNGKCPIQGQNLNPDGTAYKVSDTHVLYYIPPWSLNELEARIKAYGESALNDLGQKLYPHENPLQFRYFWDCARQQHGEVRSKGEWVFISKGVLEGSRNQPYQKQVEMIQELSQKSFVNYEVPSLRAVVAAAFLHKVATRESLYQAGNKQNQDIDTYTRVQEALGNWGLNVGAFASDGFYVSHYNRDMGNADIGILARRQF